MTDPARIEQLNDNDVRRAGNYVSCAKEREDGPRLATVCLTILTGQTFRGRTYPPRDADSDPEAVFRRVLRCGPSVALRTVVAFDNHHIPRGVRST